MSTGLQAAEHEQGAIRAFVQLLSAYAMPPDAQEVNSLRIVVRPHLNRTLMDTLANDIIGACKYLEQHGGTATPPQLHSPHQSAPKC